MPGPSRSPGIVSAVFLFKFLSFEEGDYGSNNHSPSSSSVLSSTWGVSTGRTGKKIARTS